MERKEADEAMQFWKKFYNQPMLWGLAVAVVLAIGVFIDNTPGLLESGGGEMRLGGWVEIPTMSYADSGTPLARHGFITDILADYLKLSGVTLRARDVGGVLMKQQNDHYNVLVGVLIITTLFALVVIATKQSSSTIYILGPLLTGLIIAMIAAVKSAGDMGYPGAKISLDVGKAFFNWLIWYGCAGLGMFFLAKYLSRRRLILGIDEEGPLDFSRLRQVAVATTGKTMQVVSGAGTRLERAIGDNAPPAAASASVLQSAAVVEKPRSKFRNIYCIYCGGYIKNGKWCSLCGRMSSNTTTNSADNGLCAACDAPKSPGSKFCYHCGLLLDDESEAGSHPSSALMKFCPQCGKHQSAEFNFCEMCGTKFTVPSSSSELESSSDPPPVSLPAN